MDYQLKKVVCIGTHNGIDVNAFTSSYKDHGGVWHHRPCVEIRKANSVQMLLPDVWEVINLLEEAVAFWQEESYIVTDCDEISNKS